MKNITVEWIDFISSKVHSLAELKDCISVPYEDLPVKDTKDFQVIKNIPMLMRRRLNLAGRMAVGISISALNQVANINDINKIVYASRVGESLRCVNLIQEMVLGDGVSPTEFSSAVHNSNVGTFSIIKKYHGDTVGIAAGSDTLYNALIDAYVSLKSRDLKKVLVVVYDEDITHSRVKELDQSLFNAPYALAMIVSFEKIFPQINIDECKGVDALSFAKSYILKNS